MKKLNVWSRNTSSTSLLAEWKQIDMAGQPWSANAWQVGLVTQTQYLRDCVQSAFKIVFLRPAMDMHDDQHISSFP